MQGLDTYLNNEPNTLTATKKPNFYDIKALSEGQIIKHIETNNRSFMNAKIVENDSDHKLLIVNHLLQDYSLCYSQIKQMKL
jgi:hypothetical protein